MILARVMPDLADMNTVHTKWLLAGIYIAAAAVPFVPGAEIGLALLTVFGADMAFFVWGCMSAALLMAFALGRLVPARMLVDSFTALRMTGAAGLVAEVAALPRAARAAMLADRAPRRWAAAMVRHRYLALALVLNLPANALIGGGGGLALVAGMSGMFSPVRFAATILLATAPLPVIVWAGGIML